MDDPKALSELIEDVAKQGAPSAEAIHRVSGATKLAGEARKP